MDFNEILGNLGFDWQVALANLINFLLIFYLLKRFAFGPIKKSLEERRVRIQEGLDNAQQTETELLMSQQKGEEVIRQARSEANEIIATARDEGKIIIAQAATKADEAGRDILRKAQEDIQKAQVQAEREVRERAAKLVVSSVERILREEIDEKRQQQLITRIVEEARA